MHATAHMWQSEGNFLFFWGGGSLFSTSTFKWVLGTELPFLGVPRETQDKGPQNHILQERAHRVGAPEEESCLWQRALSVVQLL